MGSPGEFSTKFYSAYQSMGNRLKTLNTKRKTRLAARLARDIRSGKLVVKEEVKADGVPEAKV